MENVEVTKLFRAPIRSVWDAYTDYPAWSEWAGLGHVTLDREGEPAPNGVGCVRVFSIRAADTHEVSASEGCRAAQGPPW
jgi:uncharacterized protein YndB with AHSA1/START domain